MTQYVIYGKFEAIEIVRNEDEAKLKVKDVYRGSYCKVGFFEARRIRKELADKLK